MVETNKLAMVAISKFFKDFFSNSKSKTPSAKPAPTIGPIKGEISMAPITTAVEFTLRPTDATRIAAIRIHKLEPEKEILSFTFSKTFCLFSSPLCKSNSLNMKWNF